MTDDTPAPTNQPGPAMWLFVFAGPAMRSSLLGGLLVGEGSIGKELAFSSIGLAVLFQCIVLGNLLAVVILPSFVSRVGIWKTSILTSFLALFYFALAVAFASKLSSGPLSTLAMYFSAAVLGFLVAIPSPVTQTLVNNATAAHSRSRRLLQSVWTAGMPAGFVVTSLVGGILLEHFDWWAALLVPLAFALLCAVSSLDRKLFESSETGHHDHGPPVSEIAAVVLAIVVFEVWTTWGSTVSWFDPTVLVLFVATPITVYLAVYQLRHASLPLISVQAFGVAGFSAAFLLLLLYQVPTTTEYEVLLLTELDKVGPEVIGDRTAFGNVGQVLGTLLAAALMLRHGYGLALVAGFILTTLALASYTLYPWYHADTFLFATRAIAGVGSGLITPALFVLALFRMPGPLQFAAGTWLVLATIGGTELGLNLFDFVLEVVKRLGGPRTAHYLSVEFGQVAVIAATAILAAVFAFRDRLNLRVAGDRASL